MHKKQIVYIFLTSVVLITVGIFSACQALPPDFTLPYYHISHQGNGWSYTTFSPASTLYYIDETTDELTSDTFTNVYYYSFTNKGAIGTLTGGYYNGFTNDKYVKFKIGATSSSGLNADNMPFLRAIPDRTPDAADISTLDYDLTVYTMTGLADVTDDMFGCNFSAFACASAIAKDTGKTIYYTIDVKNDTIDCTIYNTPDLIDDLGEKFETAIKETSSTANWYDESTPTEECGFLVVKVIGDLSLKAEGDPEDATRGKEAFILQSPELGSWEQ